MSFSVFAELLYTISLLLVSESADLPLNVLNFCETTNTIGICRCFPQRKS